MLKQVHHDKEKYVIPNSFRNLEFGNDNKLIAFVLIDNPKRKKFLSKEKSLCQVGKLIFGTEGLNKAPIIRR
jgi:hypothetical protein